MPAAAAPVCEVLPFGDREEAAESWPSDYGEWSTDVSDFSDWTEDYGDLWDSDSSLNSSDREVLRSFRRSVKPTVCAPIPAQAVRTATAPVPSADTQATGTEPRPPTITTQAAITATAPAIKIAIATAEITATTEIPVPAPTVPSVPAASATVDTPASQPARPVEATSLTSNQVPRVPSLREMAVTNIYAHRALEREAAAFMDGYSEEGSWVIHDRRAVTVTEFDKVRGFGFILEDHTGEEVFVDRRAVKRFTEPQWFHSLRKGDRVTFAKSQGEKGYIVNRIEGASV